MLLGETIFNGAMSLARDAHGSTVEISRGYIEYSLITYEHDKHIKRCDLNNNQVTECFDRY